MLFYTAKERIEMKILDRIINIISWCTICGLFVLAVFGKRVPLPGWAEIWLLPILTGAAVGYLTNWIAIWLLFKPYGKYWGFIQGVIPRNRTKMGQALGRMIPQYLLKPNELADQIGTLVREYLQNPELMADIRGKVNVFLKKYSGNIAVFLIPYVEDALHDAVEKNLTRENLSVLYDRVVMKYLGCETNRKQLAAGIVSELKTRTPELTDMLKENLRSETRQYVRDEWPNFSKWLNGDEFAGKLVDYLNWDRIENRIGERFSRADVQEAVSGELLTLTRRLQEYLRSPGSAEQVKVFLAEHRENAERFMRDYLAENIPLMADSWLKKEEFWNAVEKQLLPLVQAFILHRLKYEKEAIIRKFDFPGKIENSVVSMNMAELHSMINQVSGEHLTALQLLGYLLGGLAGLLLIFAV